MFSLFISLIKNHYIICSTKRVTIEILTNWCVVCLLVENMCRHLSDIGILYSVVLSIFFCLFVFFISFTPGYNLIYSHNLLLYRMIILRSVRPEKICIRMLERGMGHIWFESSPWKYWYLPFTVLFAM